VDLSGGVSSPATLVSPVNLKSFSWDLTDRESLLAWQKLTFFERIDFFRLRDLAFKILMSRLEFMGKRKPTPETITAYSISQTENYRLLFELSHKMIVTVVELNSGSIFSMPTIFKSKTNQLLVMEECNRCHALLSTAAPEPPLVAAHPSVRLVLYELRESDTEAWIENSAEECRVYKFDYKASRKRVVDEKADKTQLEASEHWEDAINFKSRREIDYACDLLLDIQLSSSAPGGFEIVFKTKSSGKTRAIFCAEKADFRIAEHPDAAVSRAMHMFELIASACLAANPDILAPAAHRLLCVKVLGGARPQNLGVSAYHQLRYVFNSPWQLENMWRPPTFKLSVFFSSTFTDTKRERAVIMEEILPELSRRGQEVGVQCVFTDMRWGVVDQNTLDQDTWDVCDREICRSERESCDIFFVSLQSEKYGYMPLPKYLPSSVASEVCKIKDEHVRKLFDTWYKQDLNDARARFHLQPLLHMNNKPYWDIALPVLRQYLSGFVFDEPCLAVGRSVTEWEFLRAAHIGSRDRMFWFKRDFDFEEDDQGRYWKDIKGKAKPNSDFFCEPSQKSKLESLWRNMHQFMGPNIREYRPKFSKEYVNMQGQHITSPALTTDFSKHARQLLCDAMERVIAQKLRWSARAGGLIPNFQHPSFCASSCTRNAAMISEMLFHSEMARQLCGSLWLGSNALKSTCHLVDKIALKIVNAVNEDFHSRLTGRSDVMSPVIALVGPPCSGKSAIMARV
jgi:hypothetical protein